MPVFFIFPHKKLAYLIRQIRISLITKKIGIIWQFTFQYF